MNRKLQATLLIAAVAFAACSEPDAGADTSNLSQDLLSQPGSDGASSSVLGEMERPGPDEPLVPVSEVGINRGALTAPVKVVEMSDYGCGYCRQFHEESFPTLLDEFIDTQMVEWKFVPYITGMFGNSLPATEAAECTYAQSVDEFEVLNRRLWDQQSDWKNASDPAEVIRPWVEELSIDMATFDSCVADDERLARIASATTLARQLGVRGTPTFIVLGYAPIQGALPLETFQQLLTAVHADMTQGAEGDEGQDTP